MNAFNVARAFTHQLLLKARLYDWTLQGFGMLRCHLPGHNFGGGLLPGVDFRLNIWDRRYRVPGVSLMHTHPWNFDSMILSGRLVNVRYVHASRTYDHRAVKNYNRRLLKPGPGGGLLETPTELVMLRQEPAEEFTAHSGFSSYRQRSHEIHVSEPSDGCVTLNQRERVGDDVAYVFWPEGEQWVSAEPRKATDMEVKDIVTMALEKWA